MTTAVTQAMLDALDAAIAAGVAEARQGDKSIRYGSVDEMLAARSAMARSLARQAGATDGPLRYSTASFSDDD